MKLRVMDRECCCSVPCLRRAASVEEEYEGAGGEILVDNEDNDGWLATHGKPKGIEFECSSRSYMNQSIEFKWWKKYYNNQFMCLESDQ